MCVFEDWDAYIRHIQYHPQRAGFMPGIHIICLNCLKTESNWLKFSELNKRLINENETRSHTRPLKLETCPKACYNMSISANPVLIWHHKNTEFKTGCFCRHICLDGLHVLDFRDVESSVACLLGDILLNVNGVDLTGVTRGEAVANLKNTSSPVVLRVLEMRPPDVSSLDCMPPLHSPCSLSPCSPSDIKMPLPNDDYSPLWVSWLQLPRWEGKEDILHTHKHAHKWLLMCWCINTSF